MNDRTIASAPQVVSARPAPPQAFIDAGDLPWAQLEPTVRRVLAMLGPREVAELRTGDPTVIGAVEGWCEQCGHALIHLQPGDGVVTFWISKAREGLSP